MFCFILRSNITGLFSDFIVKCIDKNFAFSDVDEIQSVANFSFAHNNFSCAKFLRFEIWTQKRSKWVHANSVGDLFFGDRKLCGLLERGR